MDYILFCLSMLNCYFSIQPIEFVVYVIKVVIITDLGQRQKSA